MAMSERCVSTAVVVHAQFCGADAARHEHDEFAAAKRSTSGASFRLFFSVGDAADCGRASRSMASMLSLVLGFAPKQQTTLEFFGHEWC